MVLIIIFIKMPKGAGAYNTVISNGLLLLTYNCEALETNVTCNCTQLKGHMGFPGGAVVRSPPANAGDTGSSPGPGRSHMPRSN